MFSHKAFNTICTTLKPACAVLFCIALAGMNWCPSALAATFVVNDLGDAGDANPGDGVAQTAGGVATLRAAIQEANTTADADTITFDPTVFASASTIPLNSQLEIMESLTIQGTSADFLTISGEEVCRVFDCNGCDTIEISNVTIANGQVTGFNVFGGACIMHNTHVTLTSCILVANSSETGAGACYVGSGATLALIGCEVAENFISGDIQDVGWGGAVYSDGGDLEFCHSSFNNNYARSNGGAVAGRGTFYVEECVFSGNTALGSAALNIKGDATYSIKDTLFINNSSPDWLGGWGGALSVGIGEISNCTFINNTASYGGGGICVFGNSAILNCTIIENEVYSDLFGEQSGGGIFVDEAAVCQIGNTVVARNTDHASSGQDVSGAFTSLGGNFIGIGDGSTGFTGAGDQVGTAASPIDPLLGPLADNGGPTHTCLPLAGSPVVDAGLDELITNPPFDGPPFYDQRGAEYLRIYGDAVDIGAVEIQADTTPPEITLIGEALLTVECGMEYIDAGVTVLDNIDGDLTDSLQVSGTVNTAAPGEYTLSYDVSDTAGNPAPTVTRTVIVEDITAPVITLLGDAAITLDCGDDYTESGATASDTCDCGLPEVSIDTGGLDTGVPGEYTITYTISDATGNPATPVTRTVTVSADDTIPPVITLLGDAAITLDCGGDYIESGATASDNCDTALPAVTIDTGGLDISVAGEYTITYTVSDAAGNPATPVTRTVTVNGPCAPEAHTADQDGNHLISLSELLRVIQFFNSSGFHCQAGTEDGYAPGAGDTACSAHLSDYNPQDWHINLSELLRLIQFFNSNGYHPCPDDGTEDGFCVGSA